MHCLLVAGQRVLNIGVFSVDYLSKSDLTAS